MRNIFSLIRLNLFLVYNNFNKKGIWRTLWYLRGIFLSPCSNRFLFRVFLTPSHKQQLEKILAEHQDTPIVIFPHRFGWSTEMFGRFQHIAMQLARKGFLYFYSVRFDEKVNGFKQIQNNLYLTNRADLLLGIKRKKIVHIFSLFYNISLDDVKELRRRKDKIVYEYVDEIHKDLAGSPIPESVIEKHNYILRNEDIIVIATADKLYREVASKRNKNFYLLTNGVCVEDFQVKKDPRTIPDPILNLVNQKKPIIGYYGAFAKWFDYDLVKYLSKNRPQYEILLIGPKHDGSFSKAELGSYINITVLPPVHYRNLPQYAIWFDVSIIPFVLNDISESTSPVKLFEYMALRHPIVSTNMPECRKYTSVRIGKTAFDFVTKVDEALLMRDKKKYKDILTKEAKENSWEIKTEVIIRALKEHGI